MTDAPNNTPPSVPPQSVAQAILTPRACAWLSLGVIAISALLFWSVLWPAIAALRVEKPPAVEPMSAGKLSVRTREFGTRLSSASEKIKARSPFSPPVVPVAAAPKVPAYYGGPKVIGVALDQVFFDNSTRIKLGETKDGIEVRSLNAPWSVNLGWSGGTYDVTLLERHPVAFDETTRVKDTLFPRGQSSTPTTEAPPPPAPPPASAPPPPTPTPDKPEPDKPARETSGERP